MRRELVQAAQNAADRAVTDPTAAVRFRAREGTLADQGAPGPAEQRSAITEGARRGVLQATAPTQRRHPVAGGRDRDRQRHNPFDECTQNTTHTHPRIAQYGC